MAMICILKTLCLLSRVILVLGAIHLTHNYVEYFTENMLIMQDSCSETAQKNKGRCIIPNHQRTKYIQRRAKQTSLNCDWILDIYMYNIAVNESIYN